MKTIRPSIQFSRRGALKAIGASALLAAGGSVSRVVAEGPNYPKMFAGVTTEILSEADVPSEALPADAYGVGFYEMLIPPHSGTSWKQPTNQFTIGTLIEGGPVINVAATGDQLTTLDGTVIEPIPGSETSISAGETIIGRHVEEARTTTNPTDEWSRHLIVEFDDLTQEPDREVSRTGNPILVNWLGYLSQSDWVGYGFTNQSLRASMWRTSFDPGIARTQTEPFPTLRYLIQGSLTLTVSLAGELPTKEIAIAAGSTVPFVPLASGGTQSLANVGEDIALLYELSIRPQN